MSDFPEDGFLFTYPLYSYLIEPGPAPGFLRDPGIGIVFVPIWTDNDLFETYLQQSKLAGNPRVSGLIIHSLVELVTFLKIIPNSISHVMIDPSARAPHVMSIFKLNELIKQLSKQIK